MGIYEGLAICRYIRIRVAILPEVLVLEKFVISYNPR